MYKEGFCKFLQKKFIFKAPAIFLKMETLLRVRRTGARPTLPIFWNWTPANIPDQQKRARFQKSKKSVKSLHPNRQPTTTFCTGATVMELQTHTPTVTFGFTYAHIAQYVLSIVSLLRSIHNVRFYNIMLYAIGMITTISKVVVQYNCLQYN